MFKWLKYQIFHVCFSFLMFFTDYDICGVIKQNQSEVQSNSVFLIICMHHFHSYILQKTLLRLVNWFQRYKHLKNAKNNRKQKTFSALFGSILKPIFPTSDWFCLITSHLIFTKYMHVDCLPFLLMIEKYGLLHANKIKY